MRLSWLKHRYARFIRRHGFARHFRSRAIWDRLELAPAATREVPAALSASLKDAASAEPEALYARLHTTAEGLSASEAAQRLQEVGDNDIGRDRPPPWWLHLLHCYANPFNLLLTLLAIVSLITADRKAAMVIGAMVLLSTVLRFWQEARGSREADALRALVGNRATVQRRTSEGVEKRDILLREVVPGDVVWLSAGDMIPADVRIIAAKDLFVSQSAMTGESLPVEKFPQGKLDPNPLACDNLAFMGTSVVSGGARALVLATGTQTFFGAMAHEITARTRPPTAFEIGVNDVSWLLIRFMLVMAPLVFAINALTKGDVLEAFLFALAVAVGLTPEMLPMIVTTTLARGAVMLSRRKVIVKRLDAIQNFGAMNVLCTDKTGTLTQDSVFLKRHLDVFGEESAAVLSLAYLNSHFHTGLKSKLDDAVLSHVEVHRELGLPGAYVKVDEIPFDFQRRRMSVVVGSPGGEHQLICKGAVDEVLSVCAFAREGESDVPLDDARTQSLRQQADELAGQGLRLVAVAVRHEPPVKHVYGVDDERDLTLVGYVAFIDPPKESAEPALAALKARGVDVKILTGDNEHVTATICREVRVDGARILTGSEIEAMSDEVLSGHLRDTSVFARLTPAQKSRIVRLLKEAGNVVGFMGDGINDAAALHAADIGISVDTAVDIAREAADIVLLEKSLNVLGEGVVEGRRTLANMDKYIRLTASSNFGNVLSVLISSLLLPFLPMLPLQLLVQNLMYDIAQSTLPFDRVDDELLARPQTLQTAGLARFMFCFGPLSSVFDLITFGVLWWGLAASTPAMQGVFQSGWFVEGLMSQTLVVHMIRTRHIPFIQSMPGVPLMVATLMVLVMAVFLPQGPLAGAFGMQPLPGVFFGYLAGVLVVYLLLAQWLKGWVIAHPAGSGWMSPPDTRT